LCVEDQEKWDKIVDFLTWFVIDNPEYLLIFFIVLHLLYSWYNLPENHPLKYYTVSLSFSTEKENVIGKLDG